MYTAEERQIYRFFDGTKQRGVDPLATWRRFVTAPDFDAAADLQSVIDRPEDMESIARVVTAARAALKVGEYNDEDGSGLTDTEVLQAIGGLVVFMQDLQKKMPISPTSQDATDCPTEGESVTQNTSDYISTEIES